MLHICDRRSLFVDLERARPYASVNLLVNLFVIWSHNKISNAVYVNAKSCLMIVLVVVLKFVWLFFDLLKFFYDLISSQVFTNFNRVKLHIIFEKL